MRKKGMLTGLLALLLAIVMLLCPAAAITYEPDFTPTSNAVYLENLDTGLVLSSAGLSGLTYQDHDRHTGAGKCKGS